MSEDKLNNIILKIKSLLFREYYFIDKIYKNLENMDSIIEIKQLLDLQNDVHTYLLEFEKKYYHNFKIIEFYDKFYYFSEYFENEKFNFFQINKVNGVKITKKNYKNICDCKEIVIEFTNNSKEHFYSHELDSLDNINEKYSEIVIYKEALNYDIIKIKIFVKNITFLQVREYVLNSIKNKKIILDLRGCVGGDISETIETLQLFSKKKYIFDFECIRANLEKSKFEIDDSKCIIQADQMIILLVDKYTCSSAEYIFTYYFKQNGNMVIGDTTKGANGIAKSYILENKYMLSLTNGKFVKNDEFVLGIKPDIFLDFSINSFLVLCIEDLKKIDEAVLNYD